MSTYCGFDFGKRSVSPCLDRDQWAGIPMPIEGRRLIIEPRYEGAAKLMAINAPNEEQSPAGFKVRNTFWSKRLRRNVTIFQTDEDGVKAAVTCAARVDLEINTLMCSDAWGIEQESIAVRTLGTLLNHRRFKQYLLTGMFLEKSKRTGIMYLFRKLRPTLAIRFENNKARLLCAMCLHPIGYYDESWAGAMCPTDDVIAHLMLMRGDEHRFWKQSNQHSPVCPSAGL